MDFAMDMEKKNKTGLVIGIVAAVIIVVVAAVAVFFVGMSLGRTPELRLQAAMTKMASEIAEYGSSLSEEIDFDAMNEFRKTGTIHSDADVSITIPDGETTNVEFGIDALQNRSLKKASFDIEIGMYGFQIPFAEAAVTSDTLYISLPRFLKDTYRVGLTNLGEEFNNSEWSGLLDRRLPGDYSVELFQENGNEAAAEELSDIWSKSKEIIKENAVLENIKEKENGRSGVRMTVAKEAVNQYMETLGEDLFASDFYALYMEELMERAGDADEGARLKEAVDAFLEGATAMRLRTNYVLDFYFDQKGRIVKISSPVDMETEDGALIAVDISFLGEERALDVIEGGMYVKNGGEIMYLGVERNASVSDTFYKEDVKLLWQTDAHDGDMTFSYVNDFNKEDMSFDMGLLIDVPDGRISFDADGEFTDIVKGEEYTFRLNNSTLAVDDEEFCYLSAVVDLECSDEVPEIPEDSVDLLGMNMQDIQEMVYEALSAIRKFNYE